MASGCDEDCDSKRCVSLRAFVGPFARTLEVALISPASVMYVFVNKVTNIVQVWLFKQTVISFFFLFVFVFKEKNTDWKQKNKLSIVSSLGLICAK